jgi:RimJ/RimL family protein N-acetyltransferase
MGVTFRPARETDRAFIEDVYFMTQRAIIDKVFGWRGDDFERDQFAHFYDRANTEIIMVDGTDRGWQSIVRHKDRMHIDSLFLLPGAQGQGIGTAILTSLIDEARSTKRPLGICTAKVNLRARRLYVRLGFVVVRQEEHRVCMEYRDGTPLVFETERLLLRPWNDGDVEHYVAMSGDAEVMRFVTPEPFDRERAERVAAYYRERLEINGYGSWIAETKSDGAFAGIILLQDVPFEAAFTPAIEVGWFLPRSSWGKGYATEGAHAALDYAFDALKVDDVIALTTVHNLRSRHVMERLGMTYEPQNDFKFPSLPPDDPLSSCVVYRIRRNDRAGGQAIS